MVIMIFIVVVLLIAWMIIIYNKLIKNRNRMLEGWSMIDVFLKKRYDLIPNLVDTVKGYSMHEQQLLEEVTRLRSEAMQMSSKAGLIDVESRLEKTLNQLVVTVEKYPELKANQHFLKLQQQLVTIENELELARRYYNGTVRENNIALESFPSNIIGNLFNLEKGTFFKMKTEV